MLSKPASYDDCKSPLVRLFVERSGLGVTAKPEEVMTTLIDRVHRIGRRTKRIDQIQHFLHERNIKHISLLPQLNCDGYIEPAGSTFKDGFTMVLRKRCP